MTLVGVFDAACPEPPTVIPSTTLACMQPRLSGGLGSMKWGMNWAKVSVAITSLCAALAIATWPSDLNGQPQGKEKGKGKAKQVQVKTTVVASGLWHPWSLAWLPNGDILVTERNGKLRTIRDGRLDPDPVAGVPPVHSVRLSGLMEILPHPKFAQNHWVYLTYTKDVGPDQVATTLAGGRLEGHQISDVKDILICDSWAGDGGSGSRLAWGRDGMLYMTTGASNGNAAQEPGSLRGKILRLRDDGTPAPGNPFAAKPGYRPAIFSMGHRNSLGLALNPVTGDIWNNENGPSKRSRDDSPVWRRRDCRERECRHRGGGGSCREDCRAPARRCRWKRRWSCRASRRGPRRDASRSRHRLPRNRK